MKTLHFYLLRQVLATLFMTVFVFTSILFIGNGLKDVLPFLMTGQVSFMLAVKGFFLLIPYLLAYSLPMGMLTASLLVFGRFSADQELIAARASGISLVSLVTPVLILSVFMSAICAYLTCEAAPSGRVAFKVLFLEATRSKAPSMILQSGQYVRTSQFTLYASKVESDGVHLKDMVIWMNDTNGELNLWYQAPRGAVVLSTNLSGTNQVAEITMEDAYAAVRDSHGWVPVGHEEMITVPIKLGSSDTGRNPEADISDMSFRRLLGEMKRLDAVMRAPIPSNTNSPAYEELRSRIKAQKAGMSTELMVSMHRQAAFSFACIGFTLIGIPLGIRAHRRETMAGMMIALVLVLIYFSFLILGNAWALHPERAPHLIMWLPDFLFEIVGGYLLWRANRRG
jgi:lipopolysaccharide export system permease protein